MLLDEVYKTKIIEIDLPLNINTGQRFFFNSDSELLNSTILGIRGIPEPLILISPVDGQPFANYGDNLTADELRSFYVSLNDNIKRNDKDTFCFWQLNLESFSNFDRDADGLIMPLKSRVNWSRSFIKSAVPLNFETKKKFILQVYYKTL